MRCYYKGLFRDGSGHPILSGTVSVYLAGTTTAASVYTSLASATVVNSVTGSATDGTFELWVDRFDYDQDQQFKLALSKAGYTSQTWDNVSVDQVVLGTYAIAADKTVTTSLNVPDGVIYQIATTKTLTFSVPFEAGLYQVFDCVGTGAVSGLKISKPVWFGATGDATADDTIPFQKSLDSLTAGGLCDIGSYSYRIARNTGTNDRWGIKITNSDVKLRGDGATLRRYNTDISSYALAYPILFIGTPDSNVAGAVDAVTVDGINFTGEDTRHATSGSTLHDGRYAIEAKNTTGLKIVNNTFIQIDSSAVWFQKPAEYDYANSVYYNTTKSYHADLTDNKLIAASHAVAGRALIHAIAISGIDHLKVTGNYFEWCDVGISGEGTYNDLDDVETDTYASGTVVGNVNRTGRAVVINDNIFYNSSEHALYIAVMDVTVNGNFFRTDNPTISNTVPIKMRARNVAINGNVISGHVTAIGIHEPSFNVSVTGNTISSTGDAEEGVIAVDSAGLSAYIDARPFLLTYYPMANINITGNTIILPEASQTHGYAIRIYGEESDANYPEGQIRNLNISGNTFKNHRVGIFEIANLARNILISGNTFDAKPFTSSGFDDTTTLNTYAALMVYDSYVDILQQVQFTNNKVYGSTYIFVTESGIGTNVHIPFGIIGNQFSYVKNLSTTDMRPPVGINVWKNNRAAAYLDGKSATTFTEGDLGRASHSYGAAAADWTLTPTESLADYIVVTSASGVVNAIIPATSKVPGHVYNILNNSGQILTFKVASQTGGTIANGKLGIYLMGATDVFEIYEQP